MDMSKQPGINCNSIILICNTFRRDAIFPLEPIDNKLAFDLKRNVIDGSKDFNLEMKTILTGNYNNKQVYNLECTFVGLFSIVDGEENLSKDDFLKYNAPAIMFPYIREHISSITQKSGMSPILLPPINIVAMLDNANNKIENNTPN